MSQFGDMCCLYDKKLVNSDDMNVLIFGMVKDNNHRTRAMTTDEEEINMKNIPSVMNFITRIQDEVHRYAISYHKILRTKNFINIKKSI